MTKKLFYPFIIIYNLAIIYLLSSTPISPHEAYLLFEGQDLVAQLIRLSFNSVDFWSLRVVFYMFGTLNIYLYYQLSKIYFKSINDVYFSTTIFMLLPGIITSMALANISVIIITVVLLFILAHKKGYRYVEILLMIILLFVHNEAIIFFISILIYSIYQKARLLLYSSIILSIISIYLYSFMIGGKPSGHFIEIFGLYSAIFSPFLFIYFLFAIYKAKSNRDILWYISFISLIFSLLLSIRQRIYITEFTSYVLVGLILMIQVYHNSLRVRLKEYQKVYKRIFYFMMSSLIISSLIIIFHQSIFNFIDNPKKHFAYDIYEIYWVSQKIDKGLLSCYDTNKSKKKYQLKYYKINSCKR